MSPHVHRWTVGEVWACASIGNTVPWSKLYSSERIGIAQPQKYGPITQTLFAWAQFFRMIGESRMNDQIRSGQELPRISIKREKKQFIELSLKSLVQSLKILSHPHYSRLQNTTIREQEDKGYRNR
jgi:hypothetical protein